MTIPRPNEWWKVSDFDLLILAADLRPGVARRAQAEQDLRQLMARHTPQPNSTPWVERAMELRRVS